MKLYLNTKWAEVEINGGKENVPIDWECKNLDSLGTLARGKSKHRPRNDPALFGDKYPFIQTAEVKDAKLWLTDKPKKSYSDFGLKQSKLWDEGTLCITIAANIAESSILTYKACFPDSVLGFVANKETNNIFVKYQIDILKTKMKNSSKGSAQDNLNLEKINLFKLPIPEIKEQEVIVSILLSKENIISKLKELIEQINKRNKFITDEILSGRLRIKKYDGKIQFYANPKENWYKIELNNKATDIPKDWDKDNLGSKCIPMIKSGVNIFEGKKKYYATGEVNNFNFEQEPTGLFSYKERPSRANLESNSNSIYFARMKSTLKVLNFNQDPDVILSTGFIGFNFRDNLVDKDFIYFNIISNSFQEEKDKKCKGGTQESLSDTSAKTLEIKMPPLEEQKLISFYLTTLFNEKNKYEILLKEEEKTFNFLIEELMSGRLRIQLKG